MAPFNIRIKPENDFVSLTILPTDKGYYKVIYYAAILTAIAPADDSRWQLIPTDQIEAGDLPFYQHTADSDRAELKLDEAFTDEVGSAINVELAGQD